MPTRLAFDVATPALLFTMLAGADLSVVLSTRLPVTATAAAGVFVVVAGLFLRCAGRVTIGALCSACLPCGWNRCGGRPDGWNTWSGAGQRLRPVVAPPRRGGARPGGPPPAGSVPRGCARAVTRPARQRAGEARSQGGGCGDGRADHDAVGAAGERLGSLLGGVDAAFGDDG
ncbi:hypothetical protein EES46_29860 [Streptomyces sp. ADI98-10]|nr:hypothetical protein EES46_29860 [Streptomyces sp. ADI98-10]